MPKLIKREKAHFRIEIRDLINHRSKTISFSNNHKITLEQIKDKIITCIER